MTAKRVSVKIQPKKGSEEAFFAEQDQRKLRGLREKAAEEATKQYRKEHKYHCFRCGSQSLPGELKEIIKDQRALSAAKNAFLSVFKK
jgi:hypothetical protein